MDLQTAIKMNDQLRLGIIQNAIPRFQPLAPQSVSATVTAANNQLTFNPILAGLLCGFIIEVDFRVVNAGAATANRTEFGAANVIDRIQFTDTNNFLRHNSKGYHFAMLNSVKMGAWYGGAIAPNLPFNCGNLNTVVSLPATLATGNTTGRMFYYVPVAYDFNSDLRGAIWAQVVNSTMPLQITLNANPGEAAGDQINKIYDGATAAGNITIDNVTVKVTQVYYDQIQRDPKDGQPLLPVVDLSWNYMLNDTIWNNLTANVDNSFAYANSRTFVSTFAIYDNNGTFNTGSDITYWKLQYANSYVQWQKNPETVFLDTRNQIGFDLPNAVYYFDHRRFPIATVNYGNADLVVQPSSVTAGATIPVLYEQFANNNSLRSASSLANG